MCLSEPWAPGSLPCGSGPLLPPYISQESEAPPQHGTRRAVAWVGLAAPANGGHQGRDPGPSRLSLPGLQQLLPLGVTVSQGCCIPRCSIPH